MRVCICNLEINTDPVHGLIHEGIRLQLENQVRPCQWFNPLEQQHSTKAELKSGI